MVLSRFESYSRFTVFLSCSMLYDAQFLMLNARASP